ncbi:ATP-binding protein involved in chromosome partitioning [Aliiruegeria haliotis]|uniref:Iron-sulfur cluster carrier protein n=1 Tax=Aliiruegeria haliotis TaxID=1280846 RepID=A0A2T0RXS3_9RHOB|nr:Mrp/NBP35 family ATP-binding protein [Aliiruegeria haliotis]PRY25989.1 ATP-binding protein involved in chromosome partitioning [Aliiruegeria haliotis]
MAISREDIVKSLRQVSLPDGGDIVSRDLVRALSVDSPGAVRFVLEAPSAEAAKAMEPVRQAAERVVAGLDGVTSVSVVLTAHTPAAQQKAPPDLKIGRHPTPQQGGPATVPGIDRLLLVGSGKGGVGKSTVSANLAVSLARQGRRVGLLDADIYGPSQPRMMGVTGRPASPDGKTIEPLHAHGVTVMSLGLLLKEREAVVWRGPMLMGALQQMLGQVAWGELDVLLIDLPPGTGDVQLTLGQKYKVDGAIIVSTPQDVALLDARRAIDMFERLKVPVVGLIENMSTYICPSCGHEAHLFGHGGVASEAKDAGMPFLGALPLELETRLAGDAGAPVVLEDGAASEAYAAIARRLVVGGMA